VRIGDVADARGPLYCDPPERRAAAAAGVTGE
jgi:hypothetical protein